MLTFHRGGKDGHVIATAKPCHEIRGNTDIQFKEPVDEIQLSHKPHILWLGMPKTRFTVTVREKNNDMEKHLRFVWKGHSELCPDANTSFMGPTIHALARFSPARLEGLAHRIGYIDMNWDPTNYFGYDDGLRQYRRYDLAERDLQRLLDVIIITNLTIQEREEEHRIAVRLLPQQSADLLG